MEKRKSPVRWSEAEQLKIYEMLRNRVFNEHRGKPLYWQIEQAAQLCLPGDRLRKISWHGNIPEFLANKLRPEHPDIFPENPVNQDLNTFAEWVADARVEKPTEDFVELFNELTVEFPELNIQAVTHSKYINPELMGLIMKHCAAFLEEPKAIEIPQAPRAEDVLKSMDSSALLMAYHRQLQIEISQRIAKETKAFLRQEDLKTPASPSVPCPPGILTVRLDAQPPPVVIRDLSNEKDIVPAVESGDTDEADSPEDNGRRKIRVTVIDHSVCRRPAELDRHARAYPGLRLKFITAPLDSKSTPTFKQNGFAVISTKAPNEWRKLALNICGVRNVKMVSNEQEIHRAIAECAQLAQQLK